MCGVRYLQLFVQKSIEKQQQVLYNLDCHSSSTIATAHCSTVIIITIMIATKKPHTRIYNKKSIFFLHTLSPYHAKKKQAKLQIVRLLVGEFWSQNN